MAAALPLTLLVAWLGLLGWGRPALPNAVYIATREPVAALTPGQDPASCAEAGVVRAIEVPTGYLDRGRMDARIYLPPCYDPQATPGYPLLVLIHGQGFTPQQWLDLGLPRRADALIRRGEAPPFIVLMPYDPPPAMRPPHSGFDEALLHDLLPWVTAHYAVRPERAYWAIGGISRGAAWAIHLGLRHWEQFGAIGGHSPPVFWSDGLQIPAWLDAIPAGQWPRIYLDIGDADRGEILRSAQEFETLLTEKGVPHQWHLNVGRHEQAYWNAHLEAYLRWYTAPWAAAEPSPAEEAP